jgi:FKBP-type peptidyl-prolyl cis-trans isomerase FkpA
VVSVKYRGTDFDGRTFDTNMDSSFHHTDPYKFYVGTGSVIQGFDEGIRLLKKGTTAKIYIPAVLGYGPNPVVKGGKGYENLIFEIEVLDVTDRPVVPKSPLKKIDTIQRKK